MFNKKQESDKTQGGSYQLPYFFNLVKVTGLAKHDSSKNSTVFKLELEDKSDNPDFEGFKRIDGTKAKGRIAEVDLGVYTKANNFKAVSDLMSQLVLLSTKAGIDVNAEYGTIFEKAFLVDKNGEPTGLKEETQEYLFKVVNAIVKKMIAKGGYFWVFINAEEYKPGKFGNYKFSQYNVGTKDKPDFIVWCKSEKCVTKTTIDEELIIGVEGINALGTNKGEDFKKMRQVGNEWELKPFKADEYEDELDGNTSIDDNDSIEEDDGLPF